MPELALNNLCKSFGQTRALKHVDLRVENGELLTLLGPSGCGKSTLLRLVAGFTTATSGSIRIGGADVTRVPPHARGIGMVFQSYALFPHLSVAKNIAFGLEERGFARAQIRQRVGELLDLIRMSDAADRFPAQLSGGQQQRVALARAVAYAPKLLLMDEPLGALDLKLREAMQLEIRRIQRELGITTLYVTHDQTEAMRISDRIAIMNDGRLEQIGSAAEIYHAPVSCFVADFLGRINFISAKVLAAQADLMRLRSTIGDLCMPGRNGFVEGAAVTLGIRPDDIDVDPSAPANDTLIVHGTVLDHSFLGNVVEMRVRVTEQLTAMIETKRSDIAYTPGQSVRLGLRPTRFRVFAQ